MGCWRLTKSRGRRYDLRSGLIDNHKQSSGLVRGHHTCAIKTSDGASRERKGWRAPGGQGEGRGGAAGMRDDGGGGRDWVHI